MKTVYLALGSNQGNREEALQEAVRRLHGPDLIIKRISSVYETAPQEKHDQPWFLNAVLEAETILLPMRLLLRIANIERLMGRKRIVPKGPRTIDIDILFHGNAVMHAAKLEIPHPRIAERRFVLEPLAELAPDLRHPENMQTVRELLGKTLVQPVKKTAIRLEVPVRSS